MNVLLNKKSGIYHVLKGDGYTLCGREAKDQTVTAYPMGKWVDDPENTCPHCGHTPEIEVDDWDNVLTMGNGDGFAETEVVTEDSARAMQARGIRTNFNRIRACGSCARQTS